MDQLALIIGLLFATVVAAVGLGERLRLPYPVLMLLLAVALTFIPGFPEIHIAPELILPLFLPPLLLPPHSAAPGRFSGSAGAPSCCWRWPW